MNNDLNTPRTLSATTIVGDRVFDPEGQDVGRIHELMLDLNNGRIAYAVLSFGGFLGIGDRLFALPWDLLTLDAPNHAFVLDVTREQLESAPGFDKNHWPDFADPTFHELAYRHWGQEPYWLREG